MYSWVRNLPIVDWHNHLDMRMLAEDKPLGSLYEVWVKTDPYKHRAMRICGEPERAITGDASEDKKWAAWKRTLPKLVGNPLFAWAEMELAWLSLDGAENISLAEWTPAKMLKRFNVEYLSPCVGAGELEGLQTTDDRLRGTARGEVTSKSEVPSPKSSFKVVPSLRMNAGDEIPEETLEKFHAAGCRVVDVSVDDVSILADAARWSHRALPTVAAYAAAHGWTMLLHMGALRETSSRLRAATGPAGGFAGMRAPVDPAVVAAFLDRLEKENAFPRTILMSLNPEAHASLAVLAGSFVEDGVPGKVQLGPAWWWCDHEEGIRDVLEKNAAYGVLSTFIGMTTDSRSLLSLVRHAYFRRVLCKWLTEKVASGSFPDDEALLRPLLENVCYVNAHAMFLQKGAIQ